MRGLSVLPLVERRESDMELFEVIKTWRSTRKYLDRPVGDGELQAVMEAVSMAPSWANM